MAENARNRSRVVLVVALPLAVAVAVQGSTFTAASGDKAGVQEASWSSDVQPIFQESCVSCHGAPGDDGEVVKEASLDLTTWEGAMAGSEYGTVIEAGDADASILVEMLEDGSMPEEGDPLTPEQIEVIRTWIAEGAENN